MHQFSNLCFFMITVYHAAFQNKNPERKIASLLNLEHYHNQTEISKKFWREIFSAIWTLNLLVTGSYDVYYNITCSCLWREK